MRTVAKHSLRIAVVLGLVLPAMAGGNVERLVRTADGLNNGAMKLYRAGSYAKAVPLAERARVIREKHLSHDSPATADTLHLLGLLDYAQGQYAAADPLYKRALAIREKAFGLEHRVVGESLNDLGLLFFVQGRYKDAEPLYVRCIAIFEKALGPNHSELGEPLNNLGLMYESQGDYNKAETLLKRSLTIREKALGLNHVDVAESLNNLGLLYRAQNRYREAEPFYTRALAIRERALGGSSPRVANSLNNLGGLYDAQGRLGEAAPLYRRALSSLDAMGPDYPFRGIVLYNLGRLAIVGADWQSAVEYWQASNVVIQRRFERGLGGMFGGSTADAADRLRWQFAGQVKVTNQLQMSNLDKRDMFARDTFLTAQWSHTSGAATSMNQMAVRGSGGSKQLAALVRERQDIVNEWEAKDKLLTAARGQEPSKRNLQIERGLGARLDRIDVRLAEIDKLFSKEFSNYSALASPRPLTATDVQKVLYEDEALILFLDTEDYRSIDEEAIIWVITRDKVRWARSSVGTGSLNRTVHALRCGLDEEEWSTPTRSGKCADHLDMAAVPGASEPLPFDLARAHELYRSLFGEIEDMINSKHHLLIVPSGPLTSLPFQVLVTQAAAEARPRTFEGYRKVAWLGRQHAITVLPAVSSLKALRDSAVRRVPAERDYLGYGNPVLQSDGPSCPEIKVSDQCPGAERVAADAGERAVVGGRGTRRSASIRRLASREGNVTETIQMVRALCPLPDTADEIRCTARGFRAAESRIRLGEDATEADIKAMNRDGTLASYRVLHFATHGLLASDVAGMDRAHAEPALVLTPPSGTPLDDDDDGLLTASEVAELQLNADWVVLSACNTAASNGSGAEALSGLARAFIYAGARALLVSHWPVYSDAAVQLTTTLFSKLDNNPQLGRAEALRKSIAELMDDMSKSSNAHPAVWAPFVVVGEGRM
jgi:CHAT domain-containing protein/tetratricopeptide (TPR) repeat protein